MKRCVRNWRIWALVGLGLILVALVPVFARFGDTDLTATSYADVIRFEAGGAVASLQIRIFDLSGRELWNSGVIPGRTIDWDRTNEWGERLAYGTYLYKAAGWDAQGNTVLDRSGKLALLPGDKVQLQSAPRLSPADQNEAPAAREATPSVQPMGLSDVGTFARIGIGVYPSRELDVLGTGGVLPIVNNVKTMVKFGAPGGCVPWGLRQNAPASATPALMWFETSDGNLGGIGAGQFNGINALFFVATAGNQLAFCSGGSLTPPAFLINPSGRIGIGTDNPSATLEVHGSAANILALYDPALPGDAKFRVEKDGDVYADGTYYCSDGAVHVGSADVAERINTSEWVEPGDVVEIDPDHPGFFRKPRSPYSTKVAGIISTSPGVVLGNTFDAKADKWEDNRPVLAIAGRVPVKATTENGPIQIGALLVSSSTPGVAMKGSDRSACLGATIGKAMEPLESGTGVIMVQVMLR